MFCYLASGGRFSVFSKYQTHNLLNEIEYMYRFCKKELTCVGLELLSILSFKDFSV